MTTPSEPRIPSRYSDMLSGRATFAWMGVWAAFALVQWLTPSTMPRQLPSAYGQLEGVVSPQELPTVKARQYWIDNSGADGRYDTTLTLDNGAFALPLYGIKTTQLTFTSGDLERHYISDDLTHLLESGTPKVELTRR